MIDIDQWTITGSLNPSRPLHKVALNDDAGTVLYISDRDGRVVRDTTGRERFWNWPGSTIHWIYPLAIRQFSGFWLQLIIWLSVIGLVSLATGAVIGVLQLRPFARNGNRKLKSLRRDHEMASHRRTLLRGFHRHFPVQRADVGQAPGACSLPPRRRCRRSPATRVSSRCA